MFTHEFIQILQDDSVRAWSLYYLDRHVLTRASLSPDEVRENYSFHIHYSHSLSHNKKGLIKDLKNSMDIPEKGRISDFRFLFEVESINSPKLLLQSDGELTQFQYNELFFSNKFLTKFFLDKISRLARLI